MKIILGIVGRIGSGKDAVSEYISKNYGFEIVAFRDAVRKVTEKEGFEPTRANMQDVGKKYREKYGPEYFTRIILEKIRKAGDKVLVKEMRIDGDVLPLKEAFQNMKIIAVETDADKRFQRMFARGRAGDPQTLEEFEKQEKREEELEYTQALKYANIRLNNNGSFGELYEKIDKLLKTIGYGE